MPKNTKAGDRDYFFTSIKSARKRKEASKPIVKKPKGEGAKKPKGEPGDKKPKGERDKKPKGKPGVKKPNEQVLTYPTLLEHAGVRTWHAFRSRFPDCPVTRPVTDGFACWKRAQAGEGPGEMNEQAQRHAYGELSVEAKEEYMQISWPEQTQYVVAMANWYKGKIGQRRAPFVRN